MSRSHVIKAVYLRNLSSYFSGVLGYLFIVVYVVAGAFLAFTPQFFADNLANLDQLTAFYPQLLLFLIPAITMSAWADEKKQGTDELLFTLPAKDWEILVGKYLAVLSVYTIALLFSVTHLIVLSYIGNPDWGVMFSTYFGYWLAGAALLGAGMFASSLTGNTTVAFVLGAVACSIPVFIAAVMNGVFGGLISVIDSIGGNLDLKTLLPEGGLFKNATMSSHLQDFSLGILPLDGIVYFLSIGILFLYLNLILIGRRHWAGGEQSGQMAAQFTVRSIALAVILISLNSLIADSTGRIDMTSEKVYSLSPTTKELVKQVDKEKPVTIQAFVSPQVPQEYVPVRKRLVGLLRQYDRLGGNRVDVRIVDVEPFSEAADEARLYGIESRQVQTERDGQIFIEDVFLGAVVNSGYDEVVVPFFDLGTPVEYELTRSIRTASKKDRLTVGVLRTDARVTGGFDMTSFRSQPEWQIVRELKKQYKVEEVSPDQAIDTDKYDVLVAIMPSSLTQPQMDNFVSYVEQGEPVLILDDPLPRYDGARTAPRMPKPRQGGNPMMGGQPPPEAKADNGEATSLLNVLQIEWKNGDILFDSDNPHPRFANQISDEYIFVSRKKSMQDAFNPTSEVTNGLQEMLAVYAGEVKPRKNSSVTFTPLLRTGGVNSGVLKWDDLVSQGMFGLSVDPRPRRVSDKYAHAIAARIEREEDGNQGGINAIFIADVDMISDMMFQIVAQRMADLELDNVVFVLNAVDELAGDTEFLRLRKRRARTRTLVRVEDAKAEFVNSRSEAEEAARKEAEERLEEYQAEFDEKQERIENDKSMDERAKRRQLAILEETTNRELAVQQEKINRDRDQKIETIKAQSERKIRAIEGRVRFWSIVFPPIPAILLGLIVWFTRLTNERSQIDESRRVKK